MTDNTNVEEKDTYVNDLESLPNFTKILKSLPKKYKKNISVEAEKTSQYRVKAHYISNNGYVLEIVITTQYGNPRIFSTSISHPEEYDGNYQVVIDKISGYSPNVVAISVINNEEHIQIIEEKDLDNEIDVLKKQRKELKQIRDEIKWMKKVLKKVGYIVVKDKEDM